MTKNKGFALASAIFLIVMLAVLGAAMVYVSTVSHTTSAMDVESARAYQAAKAGIEWGVYMELINHSCVASTSIVPPAPTLSTFTVTVNCTSTTNGNTNPPVTIYRIISTACNQPNAGNCPGLAGSMDYVERQIRASF